MENITEYQGKKYREVKRVAKVGELVKIVNAGNIPQTNNVNDYKNGDVLKIIGINFWSELPMYAKNIPQDYTDKVLNLSEYVVFEPIEQEFTLADLKPGKHVVKTRIYGLALYIGDKLLHRDSFTPINSFKEDMTHLYRNLDILEVFETTDVYSINSVLDEKYLKSVWQRIEKSPAQIELEKLEQEQRELAEKQKQIADKMKEVRKGLK
jgi:hypothetical protein